LPGLREQLAEFNVSQPTRRIELEEAGADPAAGLATARERVIQGELDGVLVLESGTLSGEGQARFFTHERLENVQLEEQLRGMLNQVAGRVRATGRNIEPAVIAEIGAPVPFQHRNVKEPEAEGGGEQAVIINMMLPFFFMFMMFMG